jgi:hypothetical protein
MRSSGPSCSAALSGPTGGLPMGAVLMRDGAGPRPGVETVERFSAFGRSSAVRRSAARSAPQVLVDDVVEPVERQVQLEPGEIRRQTARELRLARDANPVGVDHQVPDRALPAPTRDVPIAGTRPSACSSCPRRCCRSRRFQRRSRERFPRTSPGHDRRFRNQTCIDGPPSTGSRGAFRTRAPKPDPHSAR